MLSSVLYSEEAVHAVPFGEGGLLAFANPSISVSSAGINRIRFCGLALASQLNQHIAWSSTPTRFPELCGAFKNRQEGKLFLNCLVYIIVRSGPMGCFTGI
ncbi:hypothetical protein WH95_13000 [Kiloniella litopenaei]|uniref:Uncharacterized protein n=1 Tax=Kiloniella litopenaei TaxID=1549748 RepID=A0A0M2R7L6_9PROT|nr:hypothetical protein WH95_13000 [Kiloniella litopenaei]